MRRFALLVSTALLVVSCRRSAPPAPPHASPPPTMTARPVEVLDAGGLYAVRCGEVTAQWFGDAEGLASLRASAPGARVDPSLVMTSVTFRSATGGAATADLASVAGTNDSHAFDIFSPDCTYAALLVERTGPYHVVRTTEVVDYLQGHAPPVAILRGGGDGGANGVHHEARWVDSSTLEFMHSCCGGAEVWQTTMPSGSLKRVFFAAQAAHGIRRSDDGGFEVLP